jgi:hypothetical protein
LARAVEAAGHWIGNHTEHHAWFFKWWVFIPPFPSLAAFVQDEIQMCDTEIQLALGHPLSVPIFRSPYLYDDPGVRQGAAAAGYSTVWGELTHDTIPFVSVDTVKNNALEILKGWNKPEPCVLIFHDIRPATYDHIGEIVSFLQDQGFQLVHFDPGAIPPRTNAVRSVTGFTIQRVGNNQIKLSWPLQADGCKLQVASSLDGQINWTDVAEQPEMQEDGQYIVLPTSGNCGFYRLKRAEQTIRRVK